MKQGANDDDDEIDEEVQEWCNANIKLNKKGHLEQKELYKLYFGKDVCNSPKIKARVRVEVEKFIKKKYPKINYLMKQTTFNKVGFKGWTGISLL